ncbi:linoleate 13S-lipoxygenase 3-1, chloroplastic-like [Hibiscus syriacus]|nr:linoleate 13S-lipoxygenase 3-1, chloroplastic-like [Hibiscus syriacus]
MAAAKEMMGSSLIQRSSFDSSNRTTSFLFRQNQNRFLVNHVLLPSKQRSLRLRRAAIVPVVVTLITLVVAVSDNLIKVAPDQNDKGVQFKVRAAVIVRNKNNEDLNDALMEHLDAFTDEIERNVVLEIISTEEDPKIKAAKKSSSIKGRSYCKT